MVVTLQRAGSCAPALQTARSPPWRLPLPTTPARGQRGAGLVSSAVTSQRAAPLRAAVLARGRPARRESRHERSGSGVRSPSPASKLSPSSRAVKTALRRAARGSGAGAAFAAPAVLTAAAGGDGGECGRRRRSGAPALELCSGRESRSTRAPPLPVAHSCAAAERSRSQGAGGVGEGTWTAASTR